MAIGWIAFHVTDRCQLDCDHCLRDPEKRPTDLPVSLVEHVLDEAIRVYRTSHMGMTGGEPLLHPDIAALVDAAVSRGLTWHLMTNGKRFDRLVALLAANPRRRVGLTAVNVSLDGSTEATHDRIRGEGSYREVMTAISLATAHGLPFVLQMTLHAANMHEIESMALTASQLGADRLSFTMMQPTGTHHDAVLRLSAREWRDAGERIERLKPAFVMPISTAEGFHSAEPFHMCGPFRGESLHVDVRGRLNMCCQHADVPSDGTDADVVGDLRIMSLIDAHELLLDKMNRAQKEKLALLRKVALGEWDFFPCNHCLKAHGKAYWSDLSGGAGGATAKRERWNGKRTLTVLQGSKNEGEPS